MTRPRGGRLPRDVTRAAGMTRTLFVPMAEWGGVFNNIWQPVSSTEIVTYLLYLPDLDVGSAVNIRVHWSTGNTTAANTVTFRVRYALLTVGTTAVALGTTALDTTIAASNATTTANSYARTAAGVINAGTITDGQAILLSLNANATSGITLGAGNADNVNVYGVEVEYVATNL